MKHRHIDVDGVRTFYREAGPEGAPVVLLPHGYPSSSFQFRHFMPAMADRWRLVAPDYPGFGYSATPEDFPYTFDGYAAFLDRFASVMGLRHYALYLHDYGSQIGLRLAMKAPERVTALIIQNGDIYEDELGPKYKPLKDYWADPTPSGPRPAQPGGVGGGVQGRVRRRGGRASRRADQPRPVGAVVAADGHPRAPRDRRGPDGGAEGEPRLVPSLPALSQGAQGRRR
ncbi:alpha/beta fold hydrolase [Nonomuraea dietziae]|uniref:alpha/beta fold hydrolase n=1 Tax=Nonomuraea dietziae TaxID=65515 RepID=UPI0031DFC271